MMATVQISRPQISSPLAPISDPSYDTRNAPAAGQRRGGQFPISRALRPFPAISHLLQQQKSKAPGDQKPPVKIIEPPRNQKATFLLNLTQAELSRQD